MINIVTLEEMDFFAYHGVQAEERKIGNKYTVSIELTVDFSHAAQTDKLEGTVDYSEVYQIVKEVMSVPAKLLEHVAYQIRQKLKEHFKQLQAIKITVAKHNPPIGGICGQAKISIYEEF
jgi:7,8-dihydroneopterin aldolase/epimerase/oxygenase